MARLLSPEELVEEREKIVGKLDDAGIEDPDARAWVSDILASCAWWAVEAYKRGVNPLEGVFANDGSSGT